MGSYLVAATVSASFLLLLAHAVLQRRERLLFLLVGATLLLEGDGLWHAIGFETARLVPFKVLATAAALWHLRREIVLWSRSRVFKGLSVAIGCFTLSQLLSESVSFGLYLLLLSYALGFFVLFRLGARLIAVERRAATSSLLGAGAALTAVLAVLSFAFGSEERASAQFGINGSAAFLGIVSPILYLKLGEMSRRRVVFWPKVPVPLLYLALTFGLVGLELLFGSRQGLILTAISIILSSFFLYRTALVLPVALVMPGLILALLSFPAIEGKLAVTVGKFELTAIHALNFTTLDDQSTRDRLSAYEVTWEQGVSFLGYGIGSFREKFLGVAPESLYLQLYLTFGVLGVAVSLILLASLAISLARRVRRSNPDLRLPGTCHLIVFTVLCAAGGFNDLLFHPYFWSILALIAAATWPEDRVSPA